MEEEPSDSEGGVSEVENLVSADDGEVVVESGETEKHAEDEVVEEGEPSIPRSASVAVDNSSCKS